MFDIKGKRNEKSFIAGCKVTDGIVARKASFFRVFRGGKQVFEGQKLTSLKRFKDVSTTSFCVV